MIKSIIRILEFITLTYAVPGKVRMDMATRFATILAIGSGLMLPLDTVLAQAPDRKSLSAQWVQWALSIPTSVNPLLDTTGASCMVGQNGSIWFLAGGFSEGPFTRTCAVPANQVLFFPVANSFGFNTPNVCGQGPKNLAVAQMRADAAAIVDGVASKSVTVDGQRFAHIWRIQSKVFDIALPADNVFDAPCIGQPNPDVPAGIYSPAVDDGFYASIGPLSSGPHIIHIVATGSIVQDVTYNLNVVPVTLR